MRYGFTALTYFREDIELELTRQREEVVLADVQDALERRVFVGVDPAIEKSPYVGMGISVPGDYFFNPGDHILVNGIPHTVRSAGGPNGIFILEAPQVGTTCKVEFCDETPLHIPVQPLGDKTEQRRRRAADFTRRARAFKKLGGR